MPDRTAPKPKNDAQADDYQSQGILVRLGEIEPDDDPSGYHDHGDPRCDPIQQVSKTRCHSANPLRIHPGKGPVSAPVDGDVSQGTADVVREDNSAIWKSLLSCSLCRRPLPVQDERKPSMRLLRS